MMLAALITFFPILSFSQIYSYSNLNELFSSNHIRVINIHQGNNEYDGSPYENDEFVKGSLVTTAEVEYKDIPLRLNIYNNNLEYQQEGQAYELTSVDLFKYFMIGDAKFEYLPYSDGKKIDKAFFKVVEEGQANLLLKPVVKFDEPKLAAPYQDAKPATFNRVSDQVYIKVGEAEAKLASNKKSIEEIFSDKKEAITKFLSGNKIKYNNVDDMIKLVKYYNLN